MENDNFLKDYREFISFRPDRYGKATLFENEHILVGLNCLEPGQEMEKHAHEIQCRFYFLVEGEGNVWIGDEHQHINPGSAIWIPAGKTHRLKNTGDANMVLLVGIVPSKAD
jgi:quercetin dioxygenase-like cupin family protein